MATTYAVHVGRSNGEIAAAGLRVRIVRLIPNVMNKPSFTAAADGMSDGMARICRLYGVQPMVGRLYTALLLSPRPLALDELCDRVGAAKSTVSVALRKLEAARVARRLPPRGDRRDFYEVVSDPWAVLADLKRLYFDPELAMFRETSDAVERALGASDAPKGEDLAVLRARLAAFRELYEAMSSALGDVTRENKPARAPARRIPIVVEDEK
jgi:DNA-binding transcriptional regulator GbsR (MarR family)